MLDLRPADVERLLAHIGFGNLQAPYWFLGLEEGTRGLDISPEENLRRRAAHFEPIMDVAEAHRILGWDLDEKPIYTPVWQFMAKLVLSLKGDDSWKERPSAVHEYIQKRLGRDGDETFLMEMLPIPAPNRTNWPSSYERVFGSRELYEAQVVPERIPKLRSLVRDNRPAIVFAYGTQDHPRFKALFGGTEWTLT